jgi:glucose dehydrogenase
VALNPDTGKLVWWFQASPHDTHDWDNVETPVLFDAVIGGERRKLLAQGSRAGWFFVLDRTNGKNLCRNRSRAPVTGRRASTRRANRSPILRRSPR